MTEARYANFERGSLEWVLEKFFNNQQGARRSSSVDTYKVKDDFIVIYLGTTIVGAIEIDRREDRIYVFPLIGDAQLHNYRQGGLAEKLIIFRKDRVHPG